MRAGARWCASFPWALYSGLFGESEVITGAMDTFTPIVFDPDGFYTDDALKQTLGISFVALARARRIGVLKFVRKGRCILYRGDWVLDWLDTNDRHADAGGDNAN